mgnify:FL=1
MGLIVPTLNAGELWPAWLEAVSQQTYPIYRKLVVDSSSDDNTVALAVAQGFETITIARKDFNHGGTRQMAAEYLADCDFLVFLTQDALLATVDSLVNLLAPFSDPSIAISYGRQLPHKNAGAIAAHARLFNYPAMSAIKSKKDIPQLGIKTTFCSDSFACYRRSDLLAIGGFKSDLILGEDAHVAARLILADKKIAYVAEAQVYHSHDYSVTQDFKRYFDIGVFHAQEVAIFSQFGSASGEGVRFVKSELRYVYQKHQFLLVLSVIVRTFAKYIGYKLGRYERWLPTYVKRMLSMHRMYWQSNHLHGGH